MARCGEGWIKFSPGWTLAFMFIISLCIFIDRGVIAGQLDTIQDYFNIAAFEAGLLGSSFILGYILIGPLSAHMSQSHHPYKIMTISLISWIVSVIGCALSVDYGMLLSFRLLAGGAEAGTITLSTPIILNIAPKNHKALWLALLMIAGTLGGAAGIVVSALVNYFLDNWRYIFVFEGLSGIPLAVMLAMAYRDSSLLNTGRRDYVSFKVQCSSLLNNPVFMMSCFATAGINFLVGFVFWAPTIIHKLYGVSSVAASTAVGVILFTSGLIGSVFGSSMFDRYFRNKYKDRLDLKDRDFVQCQEACRVTFVMLLLATVSGVLGIAFSNIYTFFVGCSLVFVFALSCVGVLSIANLTSVDICLREQASAFQTNVGHIFGDLPAPFFVGVVISTCGYKWGEIIGVMWILLAALTMGLAWVLSVIFI